MPQQALVSNGLILFLLCIVTTVFISLCIDLYVHICVSTLSLFPMGDDTMTRTELKGTLHV